MKPVIAITMGDPRGIGPEVVAKALGRIPPQVCSPLIVGDSHILAKILRLTGSSLKVIEAEEGVQNFRPGSIPVLSLSQFSGWKIPGSIPPEESSRASFAYIAKAAELALQGKVEAIVTAPVSKESINGAGIPFRGHTEYLAEVSRTKKFVMMLTGKRLRVALVTTHLPFREVPRYLREGKIRSVIEITGQALKDYFGVKNPRIAVAALNPHAGESGLFGQEELIISRAVRQANGKRSLVSGPWPADTVFYRAQKGEFDAVVCMYHDQGLIPLKLLHFAEAVNVTLGLPFIRTSVDHGVAYDIAGRGIASSRSMEEAILMAARLARQKRKIQNLKVDAAERR